ncbi:MAG: hypothetical protein ISQ34_05615 [Rickettsiales bacterium]|nr:hypothetical protein [Rickettsiales bacterium]
MSDPEVVILTISGSDPPKKMRAIEYGISLIRAANSGISAYIDPFGRVVNKIALNEERILDVAMINRLDDTIFLKYGHLFFAFLFMLLSFLLFFKKN